MSQLARGGCGAAATRSQVKWCEFLFGNATIHTDTVTLLPLSGVPPGLFVSDPTYFKKASTLSMGIAIELPGIYKLSVHTSVIFPSGTAQTPKMLWPHWLNQPAPLNRFNTDGTNSGANTGGLAEEAYDNTFQGYTNFPNPLGGSGYGTYPEVRNGYTFDFRLGGGLATPNNTEVNFYYHQTSGGDVNFTTFSRGTIIYYPSDIENEPQGYGTTYAYP